MKIPGQKFSARVSWFAAATLAALLSAGVLYSATRNHRAITSADAQEKEARPASPDQSTSLNDQTDLAVTVYNSNIALVRDVRQLTIPAGYFRLKFMDIAATVNPPTVLMSLDNSGPRKHQIEASYLATNLSWNSDYVLTVGRDDKTADLDGWVTLTNNSGTAFHNARLQLVAGDLNRIAPNAPMAMRADMARSMVAKEQQFQQESFSEYHLYSLGRRTSVEDKETKQISLLQGSRVAVEQRLVVNGQHFYYHNQYNPGSPQKDPVMVFYKFKNEEKAGLGMPLPAGNLRVYQKDSKGGVLFIGEDHIDHTPKDETVTVHIGNAFDVVAERKQTDYKRIDTHVWEMEFEITLRNHKETPITVEVNEPIGGDWEMLSSTYKFTKTAAFAAQFKLPVDKNGTSVLKYRIRARW